MRRDLQGLCVAICCAAIIAGGCAKKEVVKKDEGVNTVASKPAAAAKAGKIETQQKSTAAANKPAAKDDSQQNSAMPASGQTVRAELEKIFFDFDSFALSSAARETLAKDAELLKKSNNAKITVEGHCDERGSDEYNIALGEKRAKAAMKYLTTLGVGADRIAVISYGKEKPADQGHDEAAWAKNRRDEFVVGR